VLQGIPGLRVELAFNQSAEINGGTYVYAAFSAQYGHRDSRSGRLLGSATDRRLFDAFYKALKASWPDIMVMQVYGPDWMKGLTP
jgi:hypothetical protein